MSFAWFQQHSPNGVLEPCWHETLFTMLHKSGPRKDFKNGRPIALLKMTYNIFSRLIIGRIQPTLDSKQAADQAGFRPIRSVDDASVALEEVCGKSWKWGRSIWMVSVDLTKAFDRIEHPALFEALLSQGAHSACLGLFSDVCSGQYGAVHGNKHFGISPWVKQRDVFNSLHFNAGLEQALRRLKDRVKGMGLDLRAVELLTNVCYAEKHICLQHFSAICFAHACQSPPRIAPERSRAECEQDQNGYKCP
ncbi:unnamed protein product [Prorocentrum cordatum]|uniref:Reverse transcriptase domain-containing protein n=1 Tax=Prorocentrum cordatum TaxID=2364126 RepID=A0ABN9RR90_9DINO|nr:unnamed protein product [Polarella glacialis]